MLLRTYRAAIRHQCFNLLKARSTGLRFRYTFKYGCRSYLQGSLRLDLGGMLAVVPRARLKSSILLLSYPLLAVKAVGVSPFGVSQPERSPHNLVPAVASKAGQIARLAV